MGSNSVWICPFNHDFKQVYSLAFMQEQGILDFI